MNYIDNTDDELILLIREDDQSATEYLLKKYAPLVKKSIRTLYLIGADTEDLSQEGMIGLFKAIQNYQPEQEASFFSFAKLCIDRQIYSAIKASNRKKHAPLNSYISLYTTANDSEMNLMDNLEAGKESNPEHLILVQENTSQFQTELKTRLSSFEKKVLQEYLEGNSYTDIANKLNKSPKSIDNAVQRIRNKVRDLQKQ